MKVTVTLMTVNDNSLNAKEISPSGSEVTFRQNNILIRCTDISKSGN